MESKKGVYPTYRGHLFMKLEHNTTLKMIDHTGPNELQMTGYWTN